MTDAQWQQAWDAAAGDETTLQKLRFMHFNSKTPDNTYVTPLGYHETDAEPFDVFNIYDHPNSVEIPGDVYTGDVFNMDGVYTKVTPTSIMGMRYQRPLLRYSTSPLNVKYKWQLENIPELQPLFKQLRSLESFPKTETGWHASHNDEDFRQVVGQINQTFKKALKDKGYDSVNSQYDYAGWGIKEQDEISQTSPYSPVTDAQVILNPAHVKYAGTHTYFKEGDPQIGQINPYTGQVYKPGDEIPIWMRDDLLNPNLRFTISSLLGLGAASQLLTEPSNYVEAIY